MRYTVTAKIYPFYMDGIVRDYQSGQPVFDAHYYKGLCTYGGALFHTYVENNERNWVCINSNFQYPVIFTHEVTTE